MRNQILADPKAGRSPALQGGLNGRKYQGWQSILRGNFTQWEQLADFLELNASQREQIITAKRFPLNLPVRLAHKIAKGTLDDPILRQFLPTKAELFSAPGYGLDIVGDAASRCSPKMLHKYEGRVLLVSTAACAMHCRYCFRQHFSYDRNESGKFDEELSLIRQDPSVHEVILSGGDPLSLSNRTLGILLRGLSAIPHVKRIRFHTRFPIGIPERIDEAFIELLKAVPQVIWFVIHSNHPRELDDEVLGSLSRLRREGVTLLNQSVLLKGVNDDLDTLKDLSERLVNHGIAPYYLHQLDRVQGASHFEVPEAQGRELVAALSNCLPGYAVPKYVREDAGQPSKTILS